MREYVKTGAEFFLSRPDPRSRWGRRARAAMRAVIEANPDADAATLLKLVDDAYPFGERAHEPYKRWLAERRVLVGDLRPPPSAEEWAAIQVAADALEEGRADEAVRLLDAQAPDRHARPCPVCGVATGKPCREADTETWTPPSFGPYKPVLMATRFVDRIIPHAGRVQP